MTDATLIGHQMRLPDGTLTLADLWPAGDVRAAIVGMSPSPKSVSSGHYYSGQVGRRQLRRIADAGLFEPSGFENYDDAALAAGIAFADIVKHPSPIDKEPAPLEIMNGMVVLEEHLERLDVPLVICPFRNPVDKLLGQSKSPVGLQEERTSWGARVFRMPSPYSPADVVDQHVSKILEVWLGLAR